MSSLPNYAIPNNQYIRRDYFFDGATTLANDGWTVGSAIASGTATVSNAIPGGALRISGAATTDNSGRQVQRATETFALVAGKRSGFEVNFRVSDADQVDLKCGVAVTDSTILASDPSDGIWFYLADGSSTAFGSIKRDSAEKGLVQLGAISDDTWHTVRCEITMDASTAGLASSVEWFVDGTNVASLRDVAQMPYDGEEILAEFMAMQSGDATGTKTADFQMSVIKPLNLS